MPLRTWFSYLPFLLEKANNERTPSVCCIWCSESIRIQRHGCYLRNDYESDEKIAVQRFRCRNPDCEHCTFSLPPRPCLPRARLPLWMLLLIYCEHRQKGQSINRLSRLLDHSWTTIGRAVDLACKILSWCEAEIRAEAMAPLPGAILDWAAFCRVYSYAFWSSRYAGQATNTIR